jgi:AraC family transcriptional activator of pobA
MAAALDLHDTPHAGAETAPGLPVQVASLAQLSQKGGWRLGLPHARPDALLIWITRGQGRARLEGRLRGLGAHNVIWLPPGTQFCIDAGPQTFGQVLRLQPGAARLLPDIAQHLRIRDVSFQGELNGFIEMIQREISLKQPLQDEALLAKFRLVEIWLRRMMLQVGEAEDRVHLALPAAPNAAHRLVQRFARLLEQHLHAGWSMADYAAALEVTPTHLTRVCRDVAGRTAADLITARQLHEARRLLCDTGVPAQDIARHLGFGSAAYFSRFIQKHTGKPPSAHRPAR